MKHTTRGRLGPLLLVTAALWIATGFWPVTALAEEGVRDSEVGALYFQPQTKLSFEYESNALQSSGAEADTIAKLVGGMLAVYDFPSRTQLIGQYQYQIWRYNSLSLFNIGLHVANVLLGQRLTDPLHLFDSIEPYAGIQIVAALPSAAPGANRVDFNILAGLTLIKSWGADRLLLFSLNVNDLRADIRPAAYSGQAVNLLYRQVLSAQLSFSAEAQVQARWALQLGTPNVLRNSIGLGMQWYPASWLMLDLNGRYTYDYARTPERRLGFFSLGAGAGSNLSFSW